MSTSPETSTEPRYSAEDLRDPAQRAAAMADYATVGSMTSAELDMKVQQALNDGLFQRNTAEDDIRLDDTFDGAEIVATTPDVPEVQDLLNQMKTQKINALRNEKFDQINTELGTIPQDQWGNHVAFMLEESLRRGEIDLTDPKPAQSGRPAKPAAGGKPAIPATPGSPAVPAEMKPADRKQLATKQAIEQIVAGLPTDEQDKFRDEMDKIARRKPEILRDEVNRKNRAKSKNAQDQQNRAEAARKRVEAADKTKDDLRARNDQINEHGLHQETLAAGTQIDPANLDPRSRGGWTTDSNGNRVRIRPQVDRHGRLLRDTVVTEASVHEEALRENEQRELVRQHGQAGADQIIADRADAAARAEAQRIASGRATETFEAAHQAWEALTPAQQLANREPELNDYGPDGNLRVRNVAAAEAEAHASDREVAHVNAAAEYFQHMIDAEPDVNIKKELIAAREVAMAEERSRQSGITREIAGRRADAMRFGDQIRRDSAAHVPTESTVRGDEPNAEEVAGLRRQAGNFDPVPFLEVKKGGVILTRREDRGPKVIESYYWADGGRNPNVVMVERRNRRTGELISQTTFTTEEPLRQRNTLRGATTLPPREIADRLPPIRTADKAALVATTGSELGISSVADLISTPGYSSQALDGPNGVYADNIRNLPSPAARARAAGELRAFRSAGRQRRGGFLFWLGNGRN